jgi:tetratricopeptide (TPR) repeat protein
MLAFDSDHPFMSTTGTGRFKLSGFGPPGRLLYLALAAMIACGPAAAQSQAPDDVPSLAAKAERLERQGDLEGAAAIYREILQLDPRSVAALNRLGALSVEQRQFNTAIDYYRRALALKPREFATNLNLGIAYIKMGNYADAEPPLKIAAEDDPDDFRARELLGLALIGREDYSAASPQLEAALRIKPDDVNTMYLLDRAYLECGDYPKALAMFKQIEVHDPGAPWLLVLEGQAYDAMGNFNRAISQFEAARQALPNDATVRFSLGFMYWKVRRYPEAESELEQALALDSRFEQAKFYLADARLMDGEPGKALPLLEDLTKQQPRNVRAEVDLGKALEGLNRPDEAVAAYQRALKIDPRQPETHYQLAQLYRKLGRNPESRRELALAERLRQAKQQRDETLLKASGPRVGPGRAPGQEAGNGPGAPVDVPEQ